MSASAFIVAGVTLAEIFSVVEEESEVTRYHPETGQPYRQRVTRQKFYLFGREISEPAERSPEYWAPGLTGLDVFDAGDSAYDERKKGWDHYDLARHVVGRAVASAHVGEHPQGGDPVVAFSVGESLAATDQVRNHLIARGCRVEPALYLVCHHSY